MLFSRCGLTTASLKAIITSLNLPALLLLLKVQELELEWNVRILVGTHLCPTFSLVSSRTPKSFATDLTPSQSVSQSVPSL